MIDKPEVKIVEDSINANGNRITTIQMKYWRSIHAELMTHRVFSRNAASSRAIPIMKMIKQVFSNPVSPRFWGLNQAWMQADYEAEDLQKILGKFTWKLASIFMCIFAFILSKLGLHKQIVNRLLEPFQQIHVIVTSTEWQNFFDLRIHPAAQPEMQDLAEAIKWEMDQSKPKLLKEGEWHLPYVTAREKLKFPVSQQLIMSVARCARVSTMNHDGSSPSFAKDLDTYNKLVGSYPPHASPLEHQATPLKPRESSEFIYEESALCRNFTGWIQNRSLVENTKFLIPDYVNH